jgi:hypothetical protein
MTRLLILGNSHAATLRRALPEAGQEWPGVTTDFWGLPGAAFSKARQDASGILRPDPEDAMSQRKAGQWNRQDHVDLMAYDQILLVGLRYGLRPAQGLMRALQPLDWGSRSGALGVSEGFLRAAFRAEILAVLHAQNARTALDHRFILMPAPYPAASVTEPGPLHEPLPAAVARLARAADLQAIYDEELMAAHEELGLTLVLQPPETQDRAFLTLPQFLEEPGRDARHMNAAYGLIALRAMASHIPDLHPDLYPASTGKRIA